MAQENRQEVKREIRIGDQIKIEIEFERVGMITISCPLIINSKRIVTAFIYDTFEKTFVNASIDQYQSMKFEIEPNDHIMFLLDCDTSKCTLKLLNIHVVRRLVEYYDGYDEEENEDVIINEVYNVIFDRHRFRSFGNCKDTPDILAFLLSFLIPIDLPYAYFHHSSADEIVEDLKKFFES